MKVSVSQLLEFNPTITAYLIPYIREEDNSKTSKNLMISGYSLCTPIRYAMFQVNEIYALVAVRISH